MSLVAMLQQLTQHSGVFVWLHKKKSHPGIGRLGQQVK